MIVDREEVIGGGFGGGGFMMMAVFLVVLFSLFRGNGFGYGGVCGPATAGVEGFTAAADMMTFNRYSNYEDPALARIERQSAVDTGTIIHAMDMQTCDIEKGIARSIENQNRLAMEAERMFYQDKIADLREAKLCLEGKLLQQETVNTINGNACIVNNRLTRIEDTMLKQPPFFAAGGVPFVNQCVPAHLAAGYAGGCCA